MKGRILFVMFLLGGVVMYGGLKELFLSEGATHEPVDASIVDIERGVTPESLNLRIGEHTAIYPAMVFEYKQGRLDFNVSASTKVTHSYYPIVSDRHPFIWKMRQMESRYGGFGRMPEDAEFPDTDGIRVFVKSTRFKTNRRDPARDSRDPRGPRARRQRRGVDGLRREGPAQRGLPEPRPRQHHHPSRRS
jgi:hypothetical protein